MNLAKIIGFFFFNLLVSVICLFIIMALAWGGSSSLYEGASQSELRGYTVLGITFYFLVLLCALKVIFNAENVYKILGITLAALVIFQLIFPPLTASLPFITTFLYAFFGVKNRMNITRNV